MSTIVFAYARMNPPTTGHQRLVAKVIETANKVGGDHCVFLSQTHNNSTDPLDFDFKYRVCCAAFPEALISHDVSIKTPYQALESFSGLYSKAILVVGSDRIENFSSMATYAKQWGFRKFSIVSAGIRTNETNDVSGMSASVLRDFATKRDKEAFIKGMPPRLSCGAKELVYNRTRKGIKKTI